MNKMCRITLHDKSKELQGRKTYSTLLSLAVPSHFSAACAAAAVEMKPSRIQVGLLLLFCFVVLFLPFKTVCSIFPKDYRFHF